MQTKFKKKKDHYTYVILNTLKPGNYSYRKDKFVINFEFEPLYVGKGKKDRWLTHIDNVKKEKEIKHHLYYSIRKILKETKKDPLVKILLEKATDKQSIKLEKILISLIGRRDLKTGPLLNMTEGGEGVTGKSKKVCKFLSECSKKNSLNRMWIHNIENNITKFVLKNIILNEKWRKGRGEKFTEKFGKLNKERKLSKQHKLKCVRKGKENGMFGKNHTKESRQLISDKLRGKKFSLERKLLISKRVSGKVTLFMENIIPTLPSCI